RAHRRRTDATRQVAAARSGAARSRDPSAAASRRSRLRPLTPGRSTTGLLDRDAQRARGTERAPVHAPVHAGSRTDAEALLAGTALSARHAGNGRAGERLDRSGAALRLLRP